RIGADREYDRNCCSCSLGCQCSRRAECKDEGDWVRHQRSGQCRWSVKTTIGRAIFDFEIAAFDIAGFPWTLPDSFKLSIIKLAACQHADQCHSRLLLRARRERPRSHRAAEQRNELAPPHGTSPPAETPGEPRLSHSKPMGAPAAALLRQPPAMKTH